MLVQRPSHAAVAGLARKWLARLCVAALGLGLVAAGWLVHGWLRPQADAQQDYARVLGGHLARLDRHAEPGRVVFLGHSSFAALDTAAVSPDGLNLSVGGESTEQLLARAASYRSVHAARVVLVNTGLNDLLRSCQPVADDALRRVVGLSPASVPMLVVGVQALAADLASQACRGHAERLIDDHNARLQAACASRAGCRFVPHPVDAVAMRTSPGRWHESDGIHLSPDGSRRLRQSLAAALAELAASAR